LLVRLYRTGLLPAGFQRKVSDLCVLTLVVPLSRASWRNYSIPYRLAYRPSQHPPLRIAHRQVRQVIRSPPDPPPLPAARCVNTKRNQPVRRPELKRRDLLQLRNRRSRTRNPGTNRTLRQHPRRLHSRHLPHISPHPRRRPLLQQQPSPPPNPRRTTTAW